MGTYIVRYGETIGDCIMNATGNLANWPLILDANGFDDWTPTLAAGQVLIIPDTVVNDLNTLRQLTTYPANNASVPDVYNKINVIFGILTDNWILATTFWRDSSVWIDTKTWLD